jgi:hypothetical protein
MDGSGEISYLFFIVVIMFLCVIALNLTAAILASRFGLIRQDMEQAKAMEDTVKFEEGKKRELSLGDAIVTAKAKAEQFKEGGIPGEPLCSCLVSVVKSDTYEWTSTILILAYVVLLSMKTADAGKSYNDLMELMDMGFAAAFMVKP